MLSEISESLKKGTTYLLLSVILIQMAESHPEKLDLIPKISYQLNPKGEVSPQNTQQMPEGQSYSKLENYYFFFNKNLCENFIQKKWSKNHPGYFGGFRYDQAEGKNCQEWVPKLIRKEK